MSKISLELQTESLSKMIKEKPYKKRLAGFEYIVLPGVFQGSTDTELFCDALKVNKRDEVWDIGTGTGLIAFTAKMKGAHYVLATDFNPYAINNVKKNAKILNLKIDIKKADIFGNIKNKFDIITFNPPFTDNKIYSEHEINFWDYKHNSIRRFFKDIRNYLKENGKVFICWSSFGKVSVIKKIASEYGFILKQIARREGKRKFVYYIYQLI